MTTKALGRAYVIRDGKIVKKQVYRDASHAIAAKKSKKTRVVRKDHPEAWRPKGDL